MKEYFRQYNDILNQIREIEYKIITLKERLYSISGVRYDDTPKGSSPGNDIVYRIQEIDDLIQEKDRLQASKEELYKKHLSDINKVDDEKMRSILRCYYLNKLSIKEIAEIHGVTPNHITKLKRDAVYEFSLLILKNDCK